MSYDDFKSIETCDGRSVFKMKKICVLTATRAEYGLLKPLILKLKNLTEFETSIVVTGAHLSPEFGLTYLEIERDGIDVDKKIEILLSADTPSAISKSMGLAMISFADYFAETEPDLLVILGDRYESLAVGAVAMNQNIPIAHLHGGEATEGAVDEAYRHALTKMSHLHFTSTERYKERVIQLGEEPSRVFNVGALGVENIMSLDLMDKKALGHSIDRPLDRPYAVVTYHPVTLDPTASEHQMKQVLDALSEHKELDYIITKGNSDAHGRIINKMIDDYALENDNVSVFTSLGVLRYLSAVKHSALVIGNSSSGIIEVPSFGIPTVNIGDRQKGRIQAESILNCPANRMDISNAITQVQSESFRALAASAVNPYGKTGTSQRICDELVRCLNSDTIDLKKKFYDISLGM